MPGPKRAQVTDVDIGQVTVAEAEQLNKLARQGVPGIEAVPDGLNHVLHVVIDRKKAPPQLLEGASQERK